MGSVRLRLLTGEDSSGEYSSEWVEVRIKADPRLVDFRAAESKRVIRRGAHKGEEKDAPIYMFLDRQLKADRTAQISGAKLMFRKIRLGPHGELESADPYLVFTCDIRDVPLTENARRIQWSETGEVTKTGKKRKKMALPEGLVTCAVDLGIRNLGFATLSRLENDTPRILRSRNIWMGMEEKEGKHPGRWSPGPDLAHLAKHKREIRTLRRLRGKPVKGEESHIELQGHITHMSDDRFKKSARAIINFALNTDESFSKATGEVYPRADVLVLERLKGFIPDAEREPGINRALVEWNRGQTVKRVREMASDVGLKVFEVSPAGTSQVCCRCGALGRRYSVGRDEKNGKPHIRFGWVEKLFACAECGYRANADHNASVNLHQRFVRGDQAVTRFFAWKNRPKREREEALTLLEEELRESLEKLHGLSPFNEQA